MSRPKMERQTWAVYAKADGFKLLLRVVARTEDEAKAIAAEALQEHANEIGHAVPENREVLQ